MLGSNHEYFVYLHCSDLVIFFPCKNGQQRSSTKKNLLWLLAKKHANGDWQVVEGVLSRDMATVNEYLQICKLNLITTKKVSAVFHLNNKEAERELKVNHNNEILPFRSERKYLGATLERSLTYLRHLESLRKSWHHASHSWSGLLVLTGGLEQQRCE